MKAGQCFAIVIGLVATAAGHLLYGQGRGIPDGLMFHSARDGNNEIYTRIGTAEGLCVSPTIQPRTPTRTCRLTAATSFSRPTALATTTFTSSTPQVDQP